jgi:hypothetical protein
MRQVVGDQWGMGVDDTHMKIRGAPVLDEPALSPHQKMIADKLAVSELMSMAIVALPPIVKVHCTCVVHLTLASAALEVSHAVRSKSRCRPSSGAHMRMRAHAWHACMHALYRLHLSRQHACSHAWPLLLWRHSSCGGQHCSHQEPEE